jgi:hypothetical protein
MKAVEPRSGAGQALVIAKDQPEYTPLPARRTADGVLTTEWELTPLEREAIARGARVRLTILTFNQPLQPVRLEVVTHDAIITTLQAAILAPPIES